MDSRPFACRLADAYWNYPGALPEDEAFAELAELIMEGWTGKGNYITRQAFLNKYNQPVADLFGIRETQKEHLQRHPEAWFALALFLWAADHAPEYEAAYQRYLVWCVGQLIFREIRPGEVLTAA